MICKTLIEPYLRYCSVVWGQCNETQKDKLQTLQIKAARIIAKVKFTDGDHPRLLRDLGWLDVRNLLELDMGIFMYKCQNKLMPNPITNLFRTVDSVHSYETRAAESGNLYIRYMAVHKSLSQTKVLKYGMKSHVRFEIPERSIASKKSEGALHENAMQRLIYHLFPLILMLPQFAMMQLIFLLLFIVSSYFSIPVFISRLIGIQAWDRA